MSTFTEGNSPWPLIAAAVRQTFVRGSRETRHLRSRRPRMLLAAAITAALASGGSVPDAHSRSTQVTWAGDVEPILSARCVRCHRTNGFAPMSLASYHDAKQWAPVIRTEVLSARM